MEQLSNIYDKLEQIQLSEGSSFEYDEQGLVNAYQLSQAQSSTLIIKVLSVIGSILATISFLAFIALAGVYDSGLGMIVTGLIFIAISLALNFKSDKLVLDTFSITTLASGIALLVSGFLILEIDFKLTCLLILIVGLFSLYFIQNFIYAFTNVLVVCGSLLAFIVDIESISLVYIFLMLNAVALVYVFLHEAYILALRNRWSRLFDPLRIGLLVSFISVVIFTDSFSFVTEDLGLNWVFIVVNSVLILYLVGRIVQIMEIHSSVREAVIFGFTILILGAISFASTISAALLLLLLSFMVQYRLGLVIGIVSLVIAVSKFYYDLDITLLHKSILLFFVGVVFFFFFLLTSKLQLNDKEV